MELIVRDVDAFEIEKRLRPEGYRQVNQDPIFIIETRSGECKVETPWLPALVFHDVHPGLKYLRVVKVYIGYPGERCIKITGNTDLVFETLRLIGIATDSLEAKEKEIAAGQWK